MSPDLDKEAAEQIPEPERSADAGTESSAAAATESIETAGPALRDRSGQPPFVLTVAALVVVVAAVVAAGWFGVGWVRAAYFTEGPRAAARDAALTDARQAATNLMSIDPSDVEGSIKLIESSMTGALLDQATQGQEQLRSRANEAKTKLESKVLGAALTSLNSELDKASALVVLQVTRSVPNIAPVSFRQTWTLDLVKKDGVWKAEQATSLGQPVPLTAPGPAAPGQPAPAPSDAPQAKPGS